MGSEMCIRDREKANECSDARWQDYTDDAIYECGFTEEELELGYYYINKTLYPQAQAVRTKHVRRGKGSA